MEPIILKLGYIAIIVGTSIIRYPHSKKNQSNEITINKQDQLEKLLLGLVALGMMILPMIYIFSDLLAFANYALPLPLQILGLLLLLPTLWLFYRSHKDLGKNWSVSLEIRAEHTIIDSGVYKHVRHPMYSAIWLWALTQPLLLNNYLAGFGGLIGFGLLYFLRVKREETMLLQEFGDAYQNYMQRTKRIIPFVL